MGDLHVFDLIKAAASAAQIHHYYTLFVVDSIPALHTYCAESEMTLINLEPGKSES